MDKIYTNSDAFEGMSSSSQQPKFTSQWGADDAETESGFGAKSSWR